MSRWLLVLALATACSSSPAARTAPTSSPPATSSQSQPPSRSPSPRTTNVYAADFAGMMSPAVRRARPLVYVPNSGDGTVDVIDPSTYRVVDHFATGKLPQHVTPSWDLHTLYVDNDEANTLTPIDPVTGKPGKAIAVPDPYNLYFATDGSAAIVVAERLRRLYFDDPHTFAVLDVLHVPCQGVDHLDFTADGTEALASCEFSGDLLRIDVVRRKVVSVIHTGGSPQDVKLSPDGRVFYVADQDLGGLRLVDAASFRPIGTRLTGHGAHGLYPSRDATVLYVSNRHAGTVSVLDFASRRIVHTWHIGGSPDMGGVSADGTKLWLSGRYDREVYVIDTTSGRLLRRIPVGNGPHGLCLFPQPGRYSLGHTGIYR